MNMNRGETERKSEEGKKTCVRSQKTDSLSMRLVASADSDSYECKVTLKCHYLSL